MTDGWMDGWTEAFTISPLLKCGDNIPLMLGRVEKI